jgi:hypothetical protein
MFWATRTDNEYYWNTHFGGVEFVDSHEEKLQIVSTKVIFDTGMSYAMIPDEDLEVILNYIKTNYGFNCVKKSLYLCESKI